MNDFEDLVHTRLHSVADRLPVTDAGEHVAAARTIHRRQRRTRLALVAVTAATVAVVGGPIAVGTMSATGPQGTRVAGPGVTDAPAETAARAAADARAAAEAAAEAAAVRAQGEADLAAAAERDGAFGQVMHDCLSQAGFETTVTGDGYEAAPAPDQEAAFDAAEYNCRQQAGYGDGRRLSPDAYRVLYADYLAVHQCLLAEGRTPDTPPSEESFVATGGDWYPYDGLTPGGAQVAQSTCPLPTY